MKNQLETPTGRVMFIRTPKRLTPQQIALALGGMADDDPRWLAFHQLLDEHLASAMLDVSAAGTINRDHAAGVVDALMALKTRLLDARKMPIQPEKPITKRRR